MDLYSFLKLRRSSALLHYTKLINGCRYFAEYYKMYDVQNEYEIEMSATFYRSELWLINIVRKFASFKIVPKFKLHNIICYIIVPSFV